MIIINLHVIVIRVGDQRCGAILQNSYLWISNPPDRTIGNKSKDNSELTMKEQYLLYKWNWSDTNLSQIYFEIDMTCDMRPTIQKGFTNKQTNTLGKQTMEQIGSTKDKQTEPAGLEQTQLNKIQLISTPS